MQELRWKLQAFLHWRRRIGKVLYGERMPERQSLRSLSDTRCVLFPVDLQVEAAEVFSELCFFAEGNELFLFQAFEKLFHIVSDSAFAYVWEGFL